MLLKGQCMIEVDGHIDKGITENKYIQITMYFFFFVTVYLAKRSISE